MTHLLRPNWRQQFRLLQPHLHLRESNTLQILLCPQVTLANAEASYFSAAWSLVSAPSNNSEKHLIHNLDAPPTPDKPMQRVWVKVSVEKGRRESGLVTSFTAARLVTTSLISQYARKGEPISGVTCE